MSTQNTLQLGGVARITDAGIALPALRLSDPATRALEGLPGATKSDDGRTWTVHTAKTIYALPIVGHILDTHPDIAEGIPNQVRDRLALAVERFGENVRASSELEPAPDIIETYRALLPSKITEKMRPYQYAALDYTIRRARKRAFLGDDPGAGKTISALSAVWATNTHRPSLIVCKATLKGNWHAEIAKWLPEGQNVHIMDGYTNVGIPDDAQWIICNYALVFQRLPDLLAAAPTSLIVDESQKVKTTADADPLGNGKYIYADPDKVLEYVSKTPAEQRKLDKDEKAELLEGVGHQAAWGLRYLSRREHTEAVFLLSATPAPNGRHYEWWPQIELLGRGDDFGGRAEFVERYCRWCSKCIDDKLRTCTHRTYKYSNFSKYKKVENRDGAINADELSKRLRSTMLVRRSQRQMYPHLPPIQPVETYLPLTDARRTHPETGEKVNWRSEYVRAEEEFIEFLKDYAADKARSSGESVGKAVARAAASAGGSNAQFVQLAKLREIAAYAKIDAVVEWLIDLVASNETEEDGTSRKAVVFAYNVAVQQHLIAELTDAITNPHSKYDTKHLREKLDAHYGKGKWPGVPAILSKQLTDTDEIEAGKARFQDVDAEPFIVCSISAAAEGHTLDSAWWVVNVQPGTAGPGVTRQMVGRCVLPGSPVLTETGVLPVERVTAGMRVMTHGGRFAEVTGTFTKSYTGRMVRLTAATGNEAVTTPDHLIWVRRDAAAPTWVEAGDVAVGDELLLAEQNKWVPVADATLTPHVTTEVHDLGVADDHSFTVDGISLHNCFGRASNPHGAFMCSLVAFDPRRSFQTIEERLHEKLKLNQVLMANTLDEGRTLEWDDPVDENGDPITLQGAMGSVFDDMLKDR